MLSTFPPQIAVLHAHYHLFSFFQIFYYFLLQHTESISLEERVDSYPEEEEVVDNIQAEFCELCMHARTRTSPNVLKQCP